MASDTEITNEEEVKPEPSKPIWTDAERQWWLNVLDTFIDAAPKGKKLQVSEDCKMMGIKAGIIVVDPPL